MKEKEFIRFYIVDGKIEWDRAFKDDSILLCEMVKKQYDPDDAV